MMIFSFFILCQPIFALEKELIKEYKQIRSILEKDKFAITDNYYFLFGSVTIEDFEDDLEFLAEASAYENLEVYAFKKICWPNYLDTETKVKIFYQYLNANPLFKENKNITVLKKQKRPNGVINIIFTFDRKNNIITFPSNQELGLINTC